MHTDLHAIKRLYTEHPEAWQLLQELQGNHTVWQQEYTRTRLENGEAVAHAAIVKCWIDHFPAHLLATLAGESTASLELLGQLIEQLKKDTQAQGIPSCLLVHVDEAYTPEFYAQLGFEPARSEGIKTPAPLARTHFLVLNLNPDFELAPGTLIYPPEYGYDNDDDF